MQNTEYLLLETLREISASNRIMADSLNKAIQFAEDNQNKYESLQPIATEIYGKLHTKSEWTEEEIHWHKELKAALINPD